MSRLFSITRIPKKNVHNFTIAVIRVSDFLASTVIPVYRFHPEKKFQQTEDVSPTRLRTLRRTLFANLSFLLEPFFRLKVYGLLKMWENELIGYTCARDVLEDLIARRPVLSPWVIPSQGLAMALRASGFFSTGQKLVSNGLSQLNYRPTGLFWMVKSLFYQNPSNALAIIKDIWANSTYSSTQFTKLSINLMRSGNRPPSFGALRERKTEIIGPGPGDLNYDKLNGRVVFFLLNWSSTREELENVLRQNVVIVVMRGGIASYIAQDGREWHGLLNNCLAIYCPKAYAENLSQTLKSDVYAISSGLTRIWGLNGEPNLIQIALGLAIGLADSRCPITVRGANLYTSRAIYRSPEVIESRNNRSFKLCENFAKHDVAINFAITKRIWKSGLIDGDDELLGALGLDLSEYLEILDRNFGRIRM